MLKLRITRELHARAKDCADMIDVPLSEFARRCEKHYLSGKLQSVAISDNLISATTEKAVVSLNMTHLDADTARRALAAGVIYAEGRNPKPFRTNLEGVDYLIEREA